MKPEPKRTMPTSRNAPTPQHLTYAGANALPAEFLEHDDSTTDMARYVIVPRLKIVQKTASKKLRVLFEDGTTILTPLDLPIVSRGEFLPFTPLFFYPEWCVWSDFGDKSAHPILERTIDPRSEIARRAQAHHSEPYGEGNRFKRAWVEHLIFIVTGPRGTPLEDTYAVMNFCRGEHLTGSKFIDQIQRRRVPGPDSRLVRAPIWLNVFEAVVGEPREKDDHDWYGFDVANPDDAEQAFVNCPETQVAYREKHLELKQLYNDQMLQADLDSDEVADRDRAWEANDPPAQKRATSQTGPEDERGI